MIQSSEITKKVLEITNPAATSLDFQSALTRWWANRRKKVQGGLRLTEDGFAALQSAQIESYKVKFEEPLLLTNQLIIWLDHYIECPFYLNCKEIYVFNESMAIQLMLFSGDIQKFSAAKAK
jgi:hypothetical protein